MSQFYSKTQEMGGWEKWHELQERAQEPVTDWYVRATRVAPGQSLVDVACGTGIPALALAARAGASGTLVAVDTSASMLATLGRKAAARSLGNIETREATAAAIGGPDAAFDVVTCKDGLMFCPDIVAAVRELHRVVKPGGRYAFSVWADPAANPAFTTLFGTLGEHLGLAPPPPDAPGPFRLAAPGELERVVRAAGFADVSVEHVAFTWAWTSVEQHFEMFSETAGPLERALQAMQPADVDTLKRKLAAAIAPFTSDAGVRIPGLQLCVSGTR